MRAPTKITLFGEHAVVYGYPAIVASVPIYVEVEAERADELIIESGPVQFSTLEVKIESDKISLLGSARREIAKYFSYIVAALENLGVKGARIRVKSELPVGAGMGTSAAVTVATLQAANKLFSLGLSKEDIHKMAWEVEKKVQGKASPMDTAASTYGGILKVWKNDEWHLGKLDVREIPPLVVGVFKKEKTTGELVREVANKLNGKNAQIYKEIMAMIGAITEKAESALLDGDVEELGELMNLNHALLEALGVVNSQTAYAVRKALELGSYGAKVSGAGSGGAVIALVPREKVNQVLTAFEIIGALKAFRVDSFANGVE